MIGRKGRKVHKVRMDIVITKAHELFAVAGEMAYKRFELRIN